FRTQFKKNLFFLLIFRLLFTVLSCAAVYVIKGKVYPGSPSEAGADYIGEQTLPLQSDTAINLLGHISFFYTY
ncbi:MAG: hypothetical protein OEZ36_13740, partial [Spirochaetota bacterium]|nr:hypothetical protein [Spirochaetota bacterium]